MAKGFNPVKQVCFTFKSMSKYDFCTTNSHSLGIYLVYIELIWVNIGIYG